jgi:hypothetical protein
MTKFYIQAGWGDVPHLTEAQKAELLASIPEHQRDARTQGIPTMGSGAIFPVPDEMISVEPFAIPSYWAQLGGLDFGWDHPTAGVKIAYDRDADCVYVVACYRVRAATPIIHAGALRAWGSSLAWAWPHDGLQHDKGSGEQLAEQYRAQGLNLLAERATFEDGSSGVEAGLMIMLDRMQTGRLKIFANCKEWFEEKRLYHRQDGKVFKELDDLLSATRYAIMMLRYATITSSSAPKANVKGII